MTLGSGEPAHLQSFTCSYIGFLQLYKAFIPSIQGYCTKCIRVYKSVYLKGFQVILKNLFTFSNRGGHSSHILLDMTTHSLHAFYLMSTILINYISSPTNDAYEPKRGLTFSSFSFIHESGTIVYPPTCFCSIVPMLDFITVQGIYTKCTMQMC